MKRINLVLIAMLLATVIIHAQNRGSERWDENKFSEIKGTIQEVDHPVAIIKGDDGKEYQLRMGPVWFWKNNGYKLDAGKEIEVSGEIENDNGIYYLYPYTIKHNSKEIRLADEDGVPVWSRGGRGYGSRYNDDRGYGRGNNRSYGRKGGRGCRCI